MNTHHLTLSVAQALLRSAESGKSATLTRPVRAPFSITISREVGGMGSAVAAAVGRRLGWPVYDRAIVEKVAEEIRKPAIHLENLDEKPASLLEECLSALSSRYPVTADQYFKYLVGAVRGLGKVGHCVIVGRGANCLLPVESTLRVRLIADYPDRLRVVAQRRGVSEAEAAAWMEKTEADRVRFVRSHFDKDPADPHLYDLVLNTSRLSVEECADLILDVLRKMEQHEPSEKA